MSIYRGFNTIGRDFGPYKLKDNSLVIRDLLNHLYIRKGEKLHNAEFGSIIWTSIFEPLTPALKEAIRKDIETVAGYDPRIRLIDRVVVQEYENGLRIDVQITFSANNEVANLALQFDRQSQKISILG
jgi:phage baseplate assembly protein W